MNAARRTAVDNILKNLLIVVNYHVGCIESKVSMRIVDHELESVVAALKAVFREYLVLTCDIVVRHEEILNLFTIDECRYVSNVCIIAVSSLNYLLTLYACQL